MSNQSKVINLNKDNFTSEVIDSPRAVLVDFWADWCAPCRAVAPVVEHTAEEFEGRLTVGKVDVDEESELARTYDIRSIPSLVVFRDGEVVEQIAGIVSFETLAEVIKSALVDAR